jgi:hypothetical protein
MALITLTAALLGRAAYQWWKNCPPSPRPMTGFDYRLRVVPNSEENRFLLQNPQAIPVYVLYRDLSSKSNWAEAAEIMLAKAQRLALENPNCEVYVTDITPTYS